MTDDALLALDAWWRAANYLTVGQIYLKENALLREPLRPEHVKPRLLGHWGTSPGLSLIYVHLNRLIRDVDANVIYLAGPGHGARRSSRTRTSRAPTARSIPRSRGTPMACSGSSASSRRRAAYRAT